MTKMDINLSWWGNPSCWVSQGCSSQWWCSQGCNSKWRVNRSKRCTVRHQWDSPCSVSSFKCTARARYLRVHTCSPNLLILRWEFSRYRRISSKPHTVKTITKVICKLRPKSWRMLWLHRVLLSTSTVHIVITPAWQRLDTFSAKLRSVSSW